MTAEKVKMGLPVCDEDTSNRFVPRFLPGENPGARRRPDVKSLPFTFVMVCCDPCFEEDY